MRARDIRRIVIVDGPRGWCRCPVDVDVDIDIDVDIAAAAAAAAAGERGKKEREGRETAWDGDVVGV